MLFEISTDSNIEGDDAFSDQVEAVIRGTLDHQIDRITRVMVHLTDENSDKKFGTHDMRCQIEVRLSGHQPISVSHKAATVEEAVDGAAGKMKNSLESTLGRLETH